MQWAIESDLRDVSECGVGLFDQVTQFVMFAGYPRSGHSLVAELLDAHANVVVADEEGVLKNDALFEQASADLLLRVCLERSAHIWSGTLSHIGGGGNRYNYSLHGLWQGKFSCLRAVGDKKGSNLPLLLQRDAPAVLRKLAWIRARGLRIKWFHVIRNPFDNIVTMALHEPPPHGHPIVHAENTSAWHYAGPLVHHKFRFYRALHEQIERHFDANSDDDVLVVYDGDLVRQPQREIRRWCRFLNVTCSPHYVDATRAKVNARISRSRDRIEWDAATVREIEQWMKGTRLLRHYNFKDD